MKRNRKITTSIRLKVVTLLLVCMTLAMIGSFISIVPGSRSSIIESTENNLMDLSQTSTLLINKSIEAVNETMTGLSHSLDLYNYLTSGGSPYKAQETIDTYLKDNSSFTSITIYNNQGTAILSSDENQVGTDGSSLTYISSVIQNGQAAQSDIIVDGVEIPSIICNIPLLSSGEDTMGVISVTVPASYITNILSDTKLRNITSSFAYLVSENGNIIYHPQAELIGTKTQNGLINKVMGILQSESMPKTKAVLFQESDKVQYTSFSVSKLNHWILVIVADEDELSAPMDELVLHSFILLLIELVIMAFIGFVIASTITKPIKLLTMTIKRISELNFTTDKESEKLCKRSDETGEMSRVIQKMRSNIIQIIEHINACSEKSNINAEDLNDICNNVNIHSNDISLTVEGVLTAMEETAATTETMNISIKQIEDSTKDISLKSLEGITITDGIVKRAVALEGDTKKAVERIQTIFSNVKNDTASALEQSHAVSKINVLTESIMDIASQIKLLSLNASIEAARAGEAGRGFAVVATEIGSLSAISTKTVSEISVVVNEVTHSVRNIDLCLQEIIGLIEKTVLPDYQGYIAISTQYSQDAEVFQKTMDIIHTEIETLAKTTEVISNSISEINTVVYQSTSDVSDISKQTVDIVQLTDKTYSKAKDSKVYAEDLKDIVSQFLLSEE